MSFSKKVAEKDERLQFLNPVLKDVKDDDEDKHNKKSKNKLTFPFCLFF